VNFRSRVIGSIYFFTTDFNPLKPTTPGITIRASGSIYCITTDFNPLKPTTPSISSRASGSIYCITTDFNPLKPPPPRISSAVGTMHFLGRVASSILAEPTALFASYLSSNNGLKSVVDKLVEATPLLYRGLFYRR
jgi:hypothetical protein